MRLLIVLPKQQKATGNFVTARRLRAGLQDLGLSVSLCAIDPSESALLTSTIDRFHPDQLLLLHAWRSGKPWLDSRRTATCLVTVLLTGTDINQGLDNPEQNGVIQTVLQQAAAIVSQNPITVSSLRAGSFPWIERLHYIPAGVLLGQSAYPLRQRHQIPKQCRLFLHPAGIRPVKANLELLLLCDEIAQQNPDFRLAFCGPKLDIDYFKKFRAALDQRPWAHYLGSIPPDAMPSALAEADLILNHSRSEGVSNALLEALAVGRPVLARNIPGNAAILTVDELYSSDQEFIDRARRFLLAPAQSAQAPATRHQTFSAENEAEQFATLFHALTP